MYKIDDLERTKEISKLLETKLQRFMSIGTKTWSDPGGYRHEEEVFELNNEHGIIWASKTEWGNASTLEPNRRGIITTLPNKSDQLGQIFEMTMPYYFSRQFNTRVYEEANLIEIRNYGRFTIGRRALKKKDFFNYLKVNGYESEINYDEENKEYVKVMEINNMDIPEEYFCERFIKLTNIVKEFKDFYRSIYK